MPHASGGGVEAKPGPYAPAELISLYRMLRSGRSFSGHERKCLFLNTGQTRWACVAAAAGVDFQDDGRAVGVVDWDQDGDQDLWMINRSGPQIRFMRNDAPGMGHFLDLRLVGKTVNRDAIGARVEVYVAGAGKRIKTLHAGEGYLAQSSKWLHFGLGDATEIDKVVVRWPGRAAEEFPGTTADARFVLTQGAGKAELWKPPARTLALKPAKLPEATGNMVGRNYFAARVPIPKTPFQDFAGKNQPLPSFAEGPMLINLWASWCKPCLGELREFTARAAELRAAKLRVLALTVNGVGGGGKGDPQSAQQFINEIGFPFVSARATPQFLDRIQVMVGKLFTMQRPLPVPTSLLVDEQGELAALYRGPVAVQQLLEDVANLHADAEKRREIACPFPGRWRTPPPASPVIRVAEGFFEAQDQEAGEMYYHAAEHLILGDATVSFQFARSLINKNRWEEAYPEIKKAVDLRPNEPVARYMFLNVLIKLGRFQEALPHAEATVRMQPDFPDAYVQLGSVLDMLGKVDQAADAFRKALALKPDHQDANLNLGKMLEKQGKLADAEAQYRQALTVAPRWADAHYSLARVLARQEKFEQALQEFDQTALCDRRYPIEVDNVRKIRKIVEERKSAGGK